MLVPRSYRTEVCDTFHLHSKKPTFNLLSYILPASIVSPDVSGRHPRQEDAVTVKARCPGGSRPSQRRTSLSVLTFVASEGRSDMTRSDLSGETLLIKLGSHRKKKKMQGGNISNKERWWNWTAAVGFKNRKWWDARSPTHLFQFDFVCVRLYFHTFTWDGVFLQCGVSTFT